MPRKVQKPKWRNEVRRRRRSPRLSALSVSLPNQNANASPHSDLNVIPEEEEEEEDESEAEQQQQQQQEAQDDENASNPAPDPDSQPQVRVQRPRPPHTRSSSSSSKKRKFRPVKERQAGLQSETSPKHNNGELPAAQLMPEKRIPELVLDVLQRRDVYEIFGEPVDPVEVQDYYEIIKEPMDFGTMRAKLHEGLYSNFQEFERDIFLITRNAMLFNSSGTIYFKQARTIDELAKKVFHTLKTDPESFEREYVASRRRSCRRIHSESEILCYGTCPKFASNAKVATTVTASSKAASNTISEATRRRNLHANPQCSGSGIRVAAADGEIKSGPRNIGRSCMSELDRRHTYRPWMSFSIKQNSIVSAVYRNMVPLIRVDQQDISYVKSLMSFVKDLGPTAQKIAKHKLRQCWDVTPEFQNPSPSHHIQGLASQIPSASASMHQKSSTSDAVLPSLVAQNFFNHPIEHQDFIGKLVEKKNYSNSGDKERADIDDGLNMYTPSRVASLEEGKSSHVVGPKGEGHLIEGVNVFGAFNTDEVGQNKNSEIRLGAAPCYDKAGDLNLSNVVAGDIVKKSTKIPELANQLPASDLATGNYQSNTLDSMINSKKNPSCSQLVQAKEMSILGQDKGLGEIVSLDNYSGTSPMTSAPGSRTGLGCHDADEVEKERQCIQSTAAPFIFDLPFLKSRLSQMKNQEDHRTLQLGLCSDKSLHRKPCINGVCVPFPLPPPLHADKPCTLPIQNYQQQKVLDGMDAKHAHLALRL